MKVERALARVKSDMFRYRDITFTFKMRNSSSTRLLEFDITLTLNKRTASEKILLTSMTFPLPIIADFLPLTVQCNHYFLLCAFGTNVDVLAHNWEIFTTSNNI